MPPLVRQISAPCICSKVTNAIVGWVSVVVTNIMVVWDGTAKRFVNQSMNKKLSSVVLFTEVYSEVPFWGFVQLENFTPRKHYASRSIANVLNVTINRPNSTKIRNLIRPDIPRNIAPNFLAHFSSPDSRAFA